MAKAHETTFAPNPKQKAFIESKAKADLFSSRMGEGKSAALCWAALYHTRRNPGAAWALIRDTFENMQATTQKEFFKWFPPGIYGTYHTQKKEFTWADGVAKGTVTFLGMDDPSDASKLMSRELAGIGMDEPAPAAGSAGIDEMIFDIAISRLRQQKMGWYALKLAENNPDEQHWSYRRFVSPGTDGFVVWQPERPENEQNLPPEYYAELRRVWAHRPDLVRRFIEGEFGFQLEGKSVTPQWSDRLHLATGLYPLKNLLVHVLWDFGHNPTFIATQRTPMGNWFVLDALVGEDIGVEELISEAIRPLLAERYRGLSLAHIGDPAGRQREQTSIMRSAVKLIRSSLGGSWRSGPVRLSERIEPLRAVLSRAPGGRGIVQVDRSRAIAVWQALRGGWHFHVSRSGIVSGEPVKNMHSHPGDAMGYGAAVLFPLGKLTGPASPLSPSKGASYFGKGPLGFERPGLIVPTHGDTIAPRVKGGLEKGDRFEY